MALESVQFQREIHHRPQSLLRGHALPRRILGSLHRLEASVTCNRLVHDANLAHRQITHVAVGKLDSQLIHELAERAGRISQAASAGSRMIAASMFTRNMKVSMTPMSA